MMKDIFLFSIGKYSIKTKNKSYMPITFDCEDEPNEFMEMPCMCDCGKWFDLHDGYNDRFSNKVICNDCHIKQKCKLCGDEGYITSKNGSVRKCKCNQFA